MSWQTNKNILIAIFCLNISIAMAWAFMGAWLIIPFAGLEVFFVGLGMYYVSWKLNFKQVITCDIECLVIEKGVYFPKQQWRWHTEQTCMIKEPSRHRMSPPRLWLSDENQRVEVGDFLNRQDKKKLLELFVELNIPITTKTKRSR